MNSTKLIPRERKEHFQLFGLEGDFSPGIIENLGLGLLEKSDKKYEKIKDAIKEDKIRMEMYRLIVEFFYKKETLPLKEFIMNLEKCIILRSLFKANGSQKKAAKFLGIKYTTLNEKIKKYKIEFKKSPYLVSSFLSE
jgi:DNA-binding NtrC family response regulator